MSRPRGRARRIIAWTAGGLGGFLLLGIVGILIWTQVGVMAAEPEPLQDVLDDPAIAVEDNGAGIVLRPADAESDVGLVFIPGAKVDPWAYASTLSALVSERDMTVVVTKPVLNLAFFDPRGLSTFAELAPGVSTWLVGGHSLGGVRACQLAHDAAGLVLFASYCATDLSGTDLPVLSLSGSEDGLSTPDDIADARDELPADARFVEIDGAAHASFGAYGPQSGDGTPTVSRDEVDAVILEEVGALADAVAPR